MAISDAGCKTVANLIKGKSADEIRALFNIVNDFTAEEQVSHVLLCLNVQVLSSIVKTEIKKQHVSSTVVYGN